MRRFDSANMLAGAARLNVRPGQFGALVLKVSGTNDADSTLTQANLGLVTAWYNNRPFVSVSWADIAILNQIEMGHQVFSSTQDDAFYDLIVIPASHVGDGNVFDFESSDNAVVEVNLSGVSADIISNGTIELFGVPQDGPMMYLCNMLTTTPNISASSTEEVEIKMDNISHCLVTTPANLSYVRLERDRKTEIDCSWNALQYFSNTENRHEAAFTSGALINLNRSGEEGEALSDDVLMTITTGAGGAGTPHIIPISLDYTPDSLVRSVSKVENMVDTKMKRKAQLGKSRPVTVAKAISGPVQRPS